MNSKKRAQHCRKKILELRRETSRLHRERNYFVANLHTLNTDYRKGILTYEDYSRYWNSIVTDLRYFERYTQQYSYKIREHEIELEHLRSTEYNVQVTKVLSFTLIVALLMFAGLSHLDAPVVSGITGFAGANQNTTSLAEIQIWISTQLSANLSDGITFELAAVPLGTVYNNATENYNASDNTLLWLTLSNDSNVDVDVCLRAETDMGCFAGSCSDYVIAAGNISWANSTSNTLSQPSSSESERYSLSYVEAMSGLVADENIYYRFWVDVPGSARPGTYNNSLAFKAVQTSVGDSC